MALDKFEEDEHTYYRLYCKCPVCLEEGKTTPTAYVKHGNDNCLGDMYVGDNAFFKCIKCGCLSHVKNWIFEWHDDGSAFLKSDSHGMIVHEVFSVVGQMVTETGQKWLMEFMDNLGELEDESR